jgi:hypothetical protein
MEIDAIIVHVSGENAANSTAYIVERLSSPTQTVLVVEKLVKKVKKNQILFKFEKHFSACTNFVPVLGGKHWDPSVLKECINRKVWTVSPSGLGYTVSRKFSKLLRRLPK